MNDEIIIEEMPTKSSRRSIRRKRNFSKAKRKRKIDCTVHNNSPWYNNLHQYSKNKIHCSCPLCAFNHPKNGWKSYTHSDLKRLEKVKYETRSF